MFAVIAVQEILNCRIILLYILTISLFSAPSAIFAQSAKEVYDVTRWCTTNKKKIYSARSVTIEHTAWGIYASMRRLTTKKWQQIRQVLISNQDMKVFSAGAVSTTLLHDFMFLLQLTNAKCKIFG